MDKWDTAVTLNIHPFLSEGENTVPQWACKLNSAPAAAETWNLKDCVLVVNTVPHLVGTSVPDDGRNRHSF
jgi:hypothetical protein